MPKKLLGDRVEQLLVHKLPGSVIRHPCGGCQKRKEALNRLDEKVRRMMKRKEK